MNKKKRVIVKVSFDTKRLLEKKKLTPEETFDNVLNRIMDKQNNANMDSARLIDSKDWNKSNSPLQPHNKPTERFLNFSEFRFTISIFDATYGLFLLFENINHDNR